MTVELTSPVLGKNVGDSYTGTLEDWLLAEGYAKRAGYTGPGVANTGPATVVPAKDPTLAANRGDKAHFPFEGKATPATLNASMANSATNLTKVTFPNPDKPDFDQGGVDEDVATPAADGDTDGNGTAN